MTSARNETCWIVLNKHKRDILSEVDLFVDNHRPLDPSRMTGELLRASLSVLSHNVFRARTMV